MKTRGEGSAAVRSDFAGRQVNLRGAAGSRRVSGAASPGAEEAELRAGRIGARPSR